MDARTGRLAFRPRFNRQAFGDYDGSILVERNFWHRYKKHDVSWNLHNRVNYTFSRQPKDTSRIALTKKTIFLILCFTLFQNFVTAALGITQDATSRHYRHWSAAHAFTQDESTVHDALPSLARQAYEEMMADAEDKDIPSPDMPATMAALAVGTDVYFSSSMKGRPFLLTPGTPRGITRWVADEVAAAIVRCQHSYPKEHRFGMSCAEPMAIQQFLVNNQQISIVGQAKISTYGVLTAGDRTHVGILDPCSVTNGGKWGCKVFLDKLQITKVGNQGKTPDLPSIEPAGALPHCLRSNPA